MKSKFVSWFCITGLFVVVVLSGCSKTNPLGPSEDVTRTSSGSVGVLAQRPLSDFLSAQGTTNLFFPPFPDYIGWANNNPQTRFALIDYTGLAAAYLAANGGPSIDTQVTGDVSERALSDGRAEVTVNLFTTNAIAWAVGVADITGPLLYGYRPADLLTDPSLQPALSRVEMHVVFTNDAVGAPLPDLVNAFILGNATAGQSLTTLSFRSSGNGPLRAAFGVADGTPGRLDVSQSGILHASGQGATADGFPAEVVNIGPVGGGTSKKVASGN
jgi:hypothetical protein